MIASTLGVVCSRICSNVWSLAQVRAEGKRLPKSVNDGKLGKRHQELKMASLALYLKWRPRRFEDVVGQEHVTHTLKNAMRGGRIAHAYLFTGPRGTGKTTMARLLAKAVNCLDEDVAVRPCNDCHICRSINEGRLMDLIEMDAASHTGVDNVREAIRDKVGFRPSEARYKVYVIDEVHMLSTSAFNALLKTLEEPPEHVIFVLATTEPHRLLPTIVSRCQRFDFRRIPLSALVARLRYIADEEDIQITDGALQFVARASTGSARDAISLLDQLTAYGDEVITVERLRSVLGYSDSESVHQLVTHLCEHEIGAGLGIIQRAVEQGVEMRQFAQQVVDYVRSILLVRVGGDLSADVFAMDLDERTRARIQELAAQFPVRDLMRAIRLFNQAQLDLRGSDQTQLALELAFVEASLVEEDHANAGAKPEPSTPGVQRPAPAESGPRTSRTAALPPAPSRSQAPPAVQAQARPGETRQQGEPVTLQEIDDRWSDIRHAIRAESRQAEALFNSAVEHWVEGGNRLVLAFASDFLSSKLEADSNRRLVEGVLRAVLGKLCRVRGAVGESAPLQVPEGQVGHATLEPGSVATDSATTGVDATAAPELGPQEEPDLLEDVTNDPVVQDLISRGGQVTGVQVLSEDK
jgi:DNA polymerase-3 subunit gamma/tau